MKYYVEIKKHGIRTYICTFNQMLSEIALECLALRRTLRANILDSDHNMYYVTCKYLKGTDEVEVYVHEQ